MKNENLEEFNERLHNMVKLNGDDALLDVSNAVGAIYIGLIKKFGEVYGFKDVNRIVLDWLREHGSSLPIDNIIKKYGLSISDKSLQSMFIILLAIIVNRNPHMEIRLIVWDKKEIVFENIGTCRYRNVAEELKVEELISFPMCHYFIEGLAEQWNENIKVEYICRRELNKFCAFRLFIEK